MRNEFLIGSLIVVALIGAVSIVWPTAAWAYAFVGPLVALGLHDVLQRKHTVLRNFPIIGHGRYLMEAIRPEIQQYFVERDTDSNPISREKRAIVYQRAKGVLDTHPFGTQRDVYEPGYEWVCHSLEASMPDGIDRRIKVGGPQCTQPYDSSALNISAMSYGALSKTAVQALNKGAERGGFSHNTGEGGVSPFHLEYGGDLVWQIGTGYFGCRTLDGDFDPGLYSEMASREEVKMVELKLSQGAKPGHGGILPAEKVTEEIAEIRHVPAGEDVISPPTHQEFSTPVGLLEFIQQLRELAGGKPVGFKLCVGRPLEIMSICKAIRQTEIYPDFITVDGKEGGTGAGPLEFVNSVGLPLRDGLTLVDNALRGAGIRDSIRIFASSKIITGFDMFRAMALGADACNSARAMMLALGCIQARRCNSNHCPTGVATQKKELYDGIDVPDKGERVWRYHKETLEGFMELLGAAGLEDPESIRPEHVMQRIDETTISSLAEIYPGVYQGALLEGEAPESYQKAWDRSSVERFRPQSNKPKKRSPKPTSSETTTVAEPT